MPVHDWTRVDAGLFHDFHHGWISALSSALNSGGLPPNYYALIERDQLRKPENTLLPEPQIYALMANRIAIRNAQDRVVAIIEIVSPVNKSTRSEFGAIVEKSVACVQRKIHLLIIDLFPAGKHDPHGIHGAIWAELD